MGRSVSSHVPVPDIRHCSSKSKSCPSSRFTTAVPSARMVTSVPSTHRQVPTISAAETPVTAGTSAYRPSTHPDSGRASNTAPSPANTPRRLLPTRPVPNPALMPTPSIRRGVHGRTVIILVPRERGVCCGAVKREPTTVSGMLQTADYARHVFLRYAELQNSVRGTEEAARSRIKRQERLYRPGKLLNALMWEAVLHTLICPPHVLAAQLDRLDGVIGMDTIHLGIGPLQATAKVPPASGIWCFDGRLVVTEDWYAELWLDDTDTIATYQQARQALSESAVFGVDAQRAIAQARRSIDVR
ncbi:DUF5753 domain-containing protein [Streptomyces sp. NPDC006510]|uniref:DUF5753 domain-containing protein n=1 Tax=Streptomyces sp. NPDC006510 TaxID=3155600 RepID=UPI0033B59E3E